MNTLIRLILLNLLWVVLACTAIVIAYGWLPLALFVLWAAAELVVQWRPFWRTRHVEELEHD